MRRVIATLVLVFGVVLASASSAMAAPPVSCPPGQAPDPKTGTCTISVTTPPNPGTPGEPGTSAGPGGSGSAPAVNPVCRYTLSSPAKEVPCSSEQGWWVQSRQCYARVASPQPATSDPVWEGGRRALACCRNRDGMRRCSGVMSPLKPASTHGLSTVLTARQGFLPESRTVSDESVLALLTVTLTPSSTRRFQRRRVVCRSHLLRSGPVVLDVVAADPKPRVQCTSLSAWEGFVGR